MPNLGLHAPSLAELERLKIGCVIHSAGVVDSGQGYEALREHNVLATLNLLTLAAERSAKFSYISSADAVALADPSRALSEDCDCSWAAIDAGRMSGYAKTKWMSEQLCFAASGMGLPVSVLRLPLISGHTETGALQLGSVPARVISSVLDLAAAPAGLGVDCVPVEKAARVAAWVAVSKHSRGVDPRSGRFVDKDPAACVTHVSAALGELDAGSIVEALWLSGYRLAEWTGREEWLDRLAARKDGLSPALGPQHLVDAPRLVSSLTAPELLRALSHHEDHPNGLRVSIRALRHMILYLRRKGSIPSVEAWAGRVAELGQDAPEKLALARKEQESDSRVRAVVSTMRSHQHQGRPFFFEGERVADTGERNQHAYPTVQAA